MLGVFFKILFYVVSLTIAGAFNKTIYARLYFIFLGLVLIGFYFCSFDVLFLIPAIFSFIMASVCFLLSKKEEKALKIFYRDKIKLYFHFLKYVVFVEILCLFLMIVAFNSCLDPNTLKINNYSLYFMIIFSTIILIALRNVFLIKKIGIKRSKTFCVTSILYSSFSYYIISMIIFTLKNLNYFLIFIIFLILLLVCNILQTYLLVLTDIKGIKKC